MTFLILELGFNLGQAQGAQTLASVMLVIGAR
jgi:hypothetical protein